MASLQHLKRRGLVPLAGLALLAYYLVILVPLSRRAADLDARLNAAWQKLSTSIEQTNVTAIDFLHITNQLAETRQSIAVLEDAKQKAASRLEMSAAVKAKMNAVFHVYDYVDDRSQQLVEIDKLAKKYQVTIEKPVRDGFPNYSTETRQPALLWAALSLVDSLLATALQCKVSVIHSLEVPLTLTNEPPANTTTSMTEIPLQLELTGSGASVLKLLENLPLRSEEMRKSGFTEERTNKAPLFIDRFIIKKQTPEKPDEIHISLRVLGYVLRD